MTAPFRSLLFVALLVVGAGCAPDTSQARGDQSVDKNERAIDWAAAKKDAPASTAATVARSDFNPQVQTASAGSPVPMLAPPIAATAAAGLTDSDGPTVRVTEDGYFATFEGPRYDVIVNGTKAFFIAPDGAPKKTDKALSDTDYRYEVGEGEVQVTFRRYGADYMIQFACKTGSPDTPCINQTDAIAFARRLQLVAQ